jgi:hypothetical protein
MTNVITRRRPRVDEEEDVVEEWERIYQLAVARKVRDPKLITLNPKLQPWHKRCKDWRRDSKDCNTLSDSVLLQNVIALEHEYMCCSIVYVSNMEAASVSRIYMFSIEFVAPGTSTASSGKIPQTGSRYAIYLLY